MIGGRLADYRGRAGLSQTAVARQMTALLGKPFSRVAVANAEAGKRALIAVELVAFAVCLGVGSVALLFTPPVGLAAVSLGDGTDPVPVDVLRAPVTEVAIPAPSADVAVAAVSLAAAKADAAQRAIAELQGVLSLAAHINPNT